MLMCPKQFAYIITVSSTVQKDSGEGGGGGGGGGGAGVEILGLLAVQQKCAVW